MQTKNAKHPPLKKTTKTNDFAANAFRRPSKQAPYWVSTEGSGVAWLHMRTLDVIWMEQKHLKDGQHFHSLGILAHRN